MNQAYREILVQKRTPLVAIAVLLVVNIALAVVAGAYQAPLLNALQTKWSELRRRAALQGRADADTVYRQGKGDLEKLAQRIPAKTQFPRVIGDLLDTAAANGVVTGGVTYRPLEIKDEHLLSYTLSLTVGGRYAAIKSFLADVQKSRDLVVIDSVALNNNDPYEEAVVLELHVTVYLREGV